MNAKEAAEMVAKIEQHISTVKDAEEHFREYGKEWQAGKLWEVGQTLEKVMDDLKERLASVKV